MDKNIKNIKNLSDSIFDLIRAYSDNGDDSLSYNEVLTALSGTAGLLIAGMSEKDELEKELSKFDRAVRIGANLAEAFK